MQGALLGEGLGVEVLLRGAGGAAFALHNAKTWNWWHYVAWTGLILLGLEIVAALVHVVGRMSGAKSILVRGRHLDTLEPLDVTFISFNRLTTALFTYHCITYAWNAPDGARLGWTLSELNLWSGLGACLAMFVVYDLFYTVFHRVLHLRSLYKYVHKHHHRQKAPSRGNADAVNVHPFEFISGEYNHLLALHLVSVYVMPVHVASAAFFVVVGGFLASLNHTRFDLRIPGIYQVRYHDVHHWYPESNYGQYTVLWDWIMGSFKPYPENGEGEEWEFWTSSEARTGKVNGSASTSKKAL
ncbi:unnamed protein product [Discosporangium mesarthrocarpum]